MTHFINWPEKPVEPSEKNNNETSFTICIEGSQKYFSSLEDWAISGLIKKKPVSLKYVNGGISSLSNCNILYITESHNLDTYLKIASEKQFLTISDKPGNGKRGVVVNFSSDKEKIGFEINLDVARSLGFKINPRLLKLAKIVSSEVKK